MILTVSKLLMLRTTNQSGFRFSLEKLLWLVKTRLVFVGKVRKVSKLVKFYLDYRVSHYIRLESNVYLPA